MKILGSLLAKPSGTLARHVTTVAIMGLLVLGAALISRPAPAQSADAGLPRATLVERLGDDYAEAPAAFGLGEFGGLIEVFASAEGATWTMVLSMPNGLSYVVTSGEGWTPVTAGGRRTVTSARSAAAGPLPRRKRRAAKSPAGRRRCRTRLEQSHANL
jgi:hypothetical protein